MRDIIKSAEGFTIVSQLPEVHLTTSSVNPVGLVLELFIPPLVVTQACTATQEESASNPFRQGSKWPYITRLIDCMI
jgi:hypothetical protein